MYCFYTRVYILQVHLYYGTYIDIVRMNHNTEEIENTWEVEFFNNQCSFRRRADLMAQAMLTPEEYDDESYMDFYSIAMLDSFRLQNLLMEWQVKIVAIIRKEAMQ